MKRPATGSKFVRQLCEYAVGLGYTFGVTGGGHLKFTKPGRTPVFCSCTPGCPRALDNMKADLRRSDRGVM